MTFDRKRKNISAGRHRNVNTCSDFHSKRMLTKKDLDRFWDLAQNLPVTTRNNHSYLSTMERQARSNLIKLLFADDESVVSSTIRD